MRLANGNANMPPKHCLNGSSGITIGVGDEPKKPFPGEHDCPGSLSVGSVLARSNTTISASAAAKSAANSQILLVDIRTPAEWRQTGIAASARPLSMLDPAFTAKLLRLVNSNRDHPIALICARGGKSKQMSARLAATGFTRIIDVPEGMLGSGWGPGWIAQGLPMRTYPPH